MKKFLNLAAWLLFLGVSVAIFLFSAQPAVQSSNLSQGVLHEILTHVVADFDTMPIQEQQGLLSLYHNLIRKTAHFSLYTLWGFSLSLLLFLHGCGFKKQCTITAAGGFLYAAGDELHQLFVDGRGAQLTDVLLDLTGVLAGVGVFSLLWLLSCFVQSYRNT